MMLELDSPVQITTADKPQTGLEKHLDHALARLMRQVAESGLRQGRSCLILADRDEPKRDALWVVQLARLQGAHPLWFAACGSTSIAEEVQRLGVDSAVVQPTVGTAASAVQELCRSSVEHVFCLSPSVETVSIALSVAASDGEVVIFRTRRGAAGQVNFYPDLHRRQVILRGAGHAGALSEHELRAAEWLLRSGKLRTVID